MMTSIRAPTSQLPQPWRARHRLTPAEIHVQGGLLLASPAAGSLRVAIAGSGTTEVIARAVAVACAQEGVEAHIGQSPFGAWQQEALDPGSSLHHFAPDIVILTTDWRDAVVDLPLATSADEVAAAVARTATSVKRIWNALAGRGVRIVHHLPAAVPYRFAGIAEWRIAASPVRQVEALRAALLELGPEIVFVDPSPLGWDAGSWHAAKLPFPMECVPDYTLMVRAALRTALGRAKKVLVLDLDNTLWGGVIGDDGVANLELGPDTPAGEAFAAFQDYLVALAARGVILAVCSKNDPAVARQGFAHPHARLPLDGIAAFECSWDDKAAGLRRIAAALNMSLDALVFVDDNPAECDLVRQALPEVSVVHLGADPEAFIARVEEGHWFDAQTITGDDLERTGAYAARARAVSECATATDLPTFLSGLGMIGRVFEARGADLDRVAQLEQKTNQFNLTTRRYDRATIRGFADRDDMLVIGATLEDKFGAHGLVASVVATIGHDSLLIENWVMSCRVFSRTFEQFVLDKLVGMARSRAIPQIVGRFRPSGRNGVVEHLFAELGFDPISDGDWRLATTGAGDAQTFVSDDTSSGREND